MGIKNNISAMKNGTVSLIRRPANFRQGPSGGQSFFFKFNFVFFVRSIIFLCDGIHTGSRLDLFEIIVVLRDGTNILSLSPKKIEVRLSASRIPEFRFAGRPVLASSLSRRAASDRHRRPIVKNPVISRTP